MLAALPIALPASCALRETPDDAFELDGFDAPPDLMLGELPLDRRVDWVRLPLPPLLLAPLRPAEPLLLRGEPVLDPLREPELRFELELFVFVVAISALLPIASDRPSTQRSTSVRM